MCPIHHRALHRGGWTITGDATSATFCRPDGRTAELAPTLPGGTLAQLVDANQRHGADIALDGAGSNWLGDHIDWDCFFAAFNDGPFAPPLGWSPTDHGVRPYSPPTSRLPSTPFRARRAALVGVALDAE